MLPQQESEYKVWFPWHSNNVSDHMGPWEVCEPQIKNDSLVSYNNLRYSVVTIWTNVFWENVVIVPTKFVKIVRIFDKIDDSESQGVI